jgi:hypothetical protein
MPCHSLFSPLVLSGGVQPAVPRLNPARRATLLGRLWTGSATGGVHKRATSITALPAWAAIVRERSLADTTVPVTTVGRIDVLARLAPTAALIGSGPFRAVPLARHTAADRLLRGRDAARIRWIPGEPDDASHERHASARAAVGGYRAADE